MRLLTIVFAKPLLPHWMSGATNPSDVVSKHCGFADAWPKLKPLLFWRGDTSSLIPIKGELQAVARDPSR